MKQSFVRSKGGADGEVRGKGQKSIIQQHQQMLKNIESTNIGKPTIVEAQRILKILDGLYNNLIIFTLFDADFIQKFHKAPKELLNALSQDGKNLLTRQAELEAKIKTPLTWQQDAFQDETPMDEEKQKEYDRMMKLLEDNFKNLLRHMKNSPDLDVIRGFQTTPNSELNDLVHCIKCQKIIMVKKLSTAAEEKEQHQNQLEELQKKIQDLEKTCTSVQNELDDLRSQRDRHNQEKKEEIEKLKNDIADVQLDKKKRMDEIANNTKQTLDQLDKDTLKKETQENKYKDESKTTFEKMKAEHAAEEGKLKTSKTRAEGTLEEYIKNYDDMMKEKHNQKEELMQEYTKITEELGALKESIQLVEKEKKREMELEEEFKKQKEAHQLQIAKREAAITHIQTIFRAYKQAAQRKKKKKKAKK